MGPRGGQVVLLAGEEEAACTQYKLADVKVVGWMGSVGRWVSEWVSE